MIKLLSITAPQSPVESHPSLSIISFVVFSSRYISLVTFAPLILIFPFIFSGKDLPASSTILYSQSLKALPCITNGIEFFSSSDSSQVLLFFNVSLSRFMYLNFSPVFGKLTPSVASASPYTGNIDSSFS